MWLSRAATCAACGRGGWSSPSAGGAGDGGSRGQRRRCGPGALAGDVLNLNQRRKRLLLPEFKMPLFALVISKTVQSSGLLVCAKDPPLSRAPGRPCARRGACARRPLSGRWHPPALRTSGAAASASASERPAPVRKCCAVTFEAGGSLGRLTPACLHSSAAGTASAAAGTGPASAAPNGAE